MSEQKNLIVAIVLSVAILLGFQFFLDRPIIEPVQQTATDGAPTVQGRVTSDGVPVPGGAPSPAQSRELALGEVARIAIDSPRLKGSISLRGARVDDLILADYHETVEKDSANITLLSPTQAANPYYADFGWTLQPGAEFKLPGADTVWQADGDKLTADRPLTLSWDNGEGLRFFRRYQLDENYMFTVTQTVENYGAAPATLFPYGRIARKGKPETRGFYILHEGLIGVFDGTLEEVDYDDVAESGRMQRTSTGGWIGITDKYWLTALVPDQGSAFEASFNHNAASDNYQADFLGSTAVEVAPGDAANVESRLFAGAKEVSVLDGYQEDLGIVNFELAIDWGWFYFLTKPIFKALHFFNGLLGNFGLAILLLTISIKILFLPLAHKSYVSMSKMKRLQPEMTKLREQYKDDRMKLNQAMMELYKKEKVNPASGCLPMVLQIPVFFSLYKVLFVTIEMRHQPFYGWIHDLSAPDPTSVFNLFGLIPWDPPQAMMIGIWPLLMGISMFLQQRLNPQPADPVQQKIFLFMPIFFTFLLGSFPAGLVIYWTWNNLLSIAQQWLIMRRMGVKA